MRPIKNIYAIALKEVASYVKSPMFYILLGMFFLLAGFYFYMLLIDFDAYCKRAAVESMALKLSLLDVNMYVLRRELLYIAYICIFFLPILTMRLLSEEKKNKTLELLMTSPVSSMDIVLGKFFAITVIWILILLLTFMYPFLVLNLPLITIDWVTYTTTLFGLFLFGLLGISIGLFASALTENQLVAAVIGFVLSAILYFMYSLYQLTDSTVSQIFFSLSSISHFFDFYKGVIDTSNIIYFVTATFLMLFISERILESQRWR